MKVVDRPDGMPSESSPSVPLHEVEREGAISKRSRPSKKLFSPSPPRGEGLGE
jgi:hypothetical protein